MSKPLNPKEGTITATILNFKHEISHLPREDFLWIEIKQGDNIFYLYRKISIECLRDLQISKNKKHVIVIKEEAIRELYCVEAHIIWDQAE